MCRNTRGLRAVYGGEGGIRTLDELLTHTPLAGERFQPLSHFIEAWTKVMNLDRFDLA